jgi:uncharacterized MAPEG superfamily protein
MDIPFLCIFIAFLLNYVSKIPVGFAMAKLKGGYNNYQPREQQAELTGWGKRALGAHLNSFEIFPAFASAVIIAHMVSVDEHKLMLLSITFIISRLVYILLYLANKGTLRSLVWFVGMLCIGSIYCLAIF